MLRSQMKDFSVATPAFREMFGEIAATEGRSYGVVVNSFCEFEPDYVRHFREAMGRCAWHVGPVVLFNRDGVRPKERQDEEAQERERERERE
ncbi:Anthocyanin 3'-O-beta-glucosyltransferase [Ananas comosus]|uniref:Anthocyanin 3'-O-beta-glucosyltransferase n=1 Tax=Ananas comosus TaxID=4615 RepID=A0A199UXP2_ANACO|nr:Anthocyanin 3'-O-beta-glucosyltransferase [Ananas comosus]